MRPHWMNFHSHSTRDICLTTVLTFLLPVLGSSCTAERSSSSPRRLRTYLRSTMTHKILNHLALLHNHKQYVDGLDVDELIDEWRKVSITRHNAVASSEEVRRKN